MNTAEIAAIEERVSTLADAVAERRAMRESERTPLKDFHQLAFLMNRAAVILQRYDWHETELEAVQNIRLMAVETIDMLSE